jgi:D-arabinose 1-dehydrogenase-like Zn-dependent alcohol dehydrogenase
MRAWALVENEAPQQEIELPSPEPQGTEVLLETTYCGVCHSDIHIWEGRYDLGGGKVMRALTIQGSYVGNPKELRELVGLAQSGRLPAIPITTVPQSQACEALMRLRGGHMVGRLVLKAEAA